MRTFRIIMPCILAVIGGSIAWYKISYPTYTYRYRLTIAVEVGGQTKTASSVIEVRDVTQPMFGSAPPVVPHVHGDAVFLNLGAKGNVVALLGCDPDGSQDCIGTLVNEVFGVAGVENFPQLETLRGRRELTGGFVPTLVTFGDLNDPKTARVVPRDHFEQVFGSGVHFKSAWIEMTRDPVTRGIEKTFPWWGRPGRPSLEAYRAWREGHTVGPSIEPETLFKRG
jgi:hypothetical protein